MTWILPPSGTTLQRSTEKYSTLQLTSSSEGFHAPILALQANNSELNPIQEADFSSTSCDLFGNSIPNISSSKMLQQYALTGLTPYCGKLPKRGMMLSGVAYPLLKLEPRIKEIVGGSWPTPKHGDWKQDGLEATKRRMEKYSTANLNALVRMWPTPNARDWKDTATQGNRKSPNLGTCAITASRQYQDRHNSSGSHPASWPTPTANRWDGLQSHGKNVVSGQLNPAWVEPLMGYPTGWTESKHWATVLCPKRRGKRSGD